MTDKKTEALKLALESLVDNRHYIVANERTEYLEIYDKAIDAVEKALAEQPAQQDSTCNKKLREQGKAYPRTCKKCGLGPCIADRVQPAPVEKPHEQQEPVACKTLCELCVKRGYHFCANAAQTTPIPSPPASKPWVGLTEEDIEAAMPGGIYDCLADPWDCGVGDGDYMRSIKKDVVRIVRAIETKLKEKNT